MNLLKPMPRSGVDRDRKGMETGMGKVISGAIIGAIIGLAAAGFFWRYFASSPDQMPQAEAWPAVLESQLKLTKSLEEDGIPTLVALSEELYWLRRTEAQQSHLTLMMGRADGNSDSGDEEQKALRFLIERVSASLEHELNRWQGQIDRLNNVSEAERGAALRLLAFAKWQQKGGAYQYAYEFFQQLSQSSMASRKPPTPRALPPTPTAEATARPTEPKATPTRKPRPRTHTPVSTQDEP